MPLSTSARTVICHLEIFFNLLQSYGNVYNILLVSIDRYIYIAKPMEYISIVTPKRALAIIVSAWVALIVQISAIINWNSDINAQVPCRWTEVLYKIGNFVTLFQLCVITFCVIVPIYGRIGCIVRNLSKNEPHISCIAPENQVEKKKEKQERRMAKTMGWVLGVYLLCFLPLSIYDLAITMLYEAPLPFGILLGNRILNVVFKMQCILNPFVYGWKNQMFRGAYLKVLGNKNSTVVPN